jgi:hypothetical protein
VRIALDSTTGKVSTSTDIPARLEAADPPR